MYVTRYYIFFFPVNASIGNYKNGFREALMSAIKWFLSFLKKYRKSVVLGLFLTVLITALNIVNPYISGLIVDEVIKENRHTLLLPLIGCMLGVIIIKGGLRFLPVDF